LGFAKQWAPAGHSRHSGRITKSEYKQNWTFFNFFSYFWYRCTKIPSIGLPRVCK